MTPFGDRHSGAGRQVPHSLHDVAANGGVRIEYAFGSALEHADAEVGHHVHQADDLIPLCQPGRDRPVVGGLVVLAP